MATLSVYSDIGSSVPLVAKSKEIHSVREQMERLLVSPHFSHSKRYPVFLRYVIEQTLDGRADELKERTIGVEVFQREPDYDTNLDPVVRVTASEVRRRIAQYYQDSNNRDAIRVELPPGSYIPQFKLQKVAASGDIGPLASLSAPVEYPSSVEHLASDLSRESAPPSIAVSLPEPKRVWIAWVVASAALVTSCTVAARAVHSRQPSIETTWAPLLSPNVPLLISIGQHSTPESAQDSSAKTTSVADHAHVNYVVLSDVQSLVGITSMLAGLKQRVRIQSAANTTYADLRQQPAILLGGFNNQWTKRALSPLRFNFERDGANHLYFIKDQRSPDSRTWSVDFSQDYAGLTHDYGIVARFIDPTTDRVVFIIAGIGEDGTKAASEFVTEPENIRSLFSGSNGKPNSQNFEAVIGTQVVNGVSGPPHMLAKEVW